jgi:hypothetical protein
MNVNPNPWIIEQRIEYCKDRAKQNGFRLERGDGNNTINVVADKPPYGKDVVIARLYDWSLVEMYLIGYEQGKMETNVVAALAKGKKDKAEYASKIPHDKMR